jgi:hypothetical protein
VVLTNGHLILSGLPFDSSFFNNQQVSKSHYSSSHAHALKAKDAYSKNSLVSPVGSALTRIGRPEACPHTAVRVNWTNQSLIREHDEVDHHMTIESEGRNAVSKGVKLKEKRSFVHT